MRQRPNNHDCADPLERVMATFGLSHTELAGLLGVRPQSASHWLAKDVPASRREKLGTVLAIVDLLEHKLEPGRLPEVVA
jgi:hypothetical protein